MANSIKIQGRIIEKFGIQHINEKFSVQKFRVTETIDQYPQTYEIQSSGKTLGLLDQLAVGEEVIMDVNILGKLVPGKDGKPDMVFNTISLWKIEKAGKLGGQSTHHPYANQSNGQSDDLPF